MKHLIYILIGLFIICSTADKSYGQFWKKKGATSSKKRDAFAGKSKKVKVTKEEKVLLEAENLGKAEKNNNIYFLRRYE
jgi:hypothetical protein